MPEIATTLLAIERLISEAKKSELPNPGHDVDRLIDLVSAELRKLRSSRRAQAGTASARGLAPWQVKRVTTYMRENLEAEIDLRQLADLIDLSRFYFCSAFRLATGYTPHEWLARLRMDEARRLLVIRSMPVTDIALAVGYQTPSAFAAAFRRVVGLSPREFRRAL